jgi:hypothetical protein
LGQETGFANVLAAASLAGATMFAVALLSSSDARPTR